MGLSDKLRGKTKGLEDKAREAMSKAEGGGQATSDETTKRQAGQETSADTQQAGDKPKGPGENR